MQQLSEESDRDSNTSAPIPRRIQQHAGREESKLHSVSHFRRCLHILTSCSAGSVLCAHLIVEERFDLHPREEEHGY